MQKQRDYSSQDKRFSKQAMSKEISESNYQTRDEAKRVFMLKGKTKVNNSDLDGELRQDSPTRVRRQNYNVKSRIFVQRK